MESKKLRNAIIGSLSLNFRLAQMQTEGLSHSDSLLQLPFRGNCMNWVLGHILVSQDDILDLLGEFKLLAPERQQRYGTNSELIMGDDEKILQLDDLMILYEKGHKNIVKVFAEIGEDEPMGEDESDSDSLSEKIHGLMWHITYHTGQLELLRQLAGKNDKVV